MSTSFRQESTSSAGAAFPAPRRGFLFFFAFAAVGAGMAVLVPAVLTLSVKATLLDPAGATTMVSIVTSISALCSLVAFPVFGRLSDRTTGRFGRRRPFLLLGAVLFTLGAIGLQLGTTTFALTVAASCTTVGASAATVAFTSVIPDQLPPDRRGPASAVVGLALPVGAVVGLFIAQLVAPNLPAMILLPAGLAVLGTLLLTFTMRDRRLSPEERPAFAWRDLPRTFWVNPVRHPNFGFTWLSRLLIFFGVAAIQAYQAFYLMNVFHISPAGIANAVFLSTLVLTGAALLFAPLAGKISDRIGRRKPFVVTAAVIFGIGLLFATFTSTYPLFLVAMGIIGLGQGVYFAVDIALITQVLPNPDDTAKDLGLMNLAGNLPTSIVPALAPAILAIGASAAVPQNFPALFIAGAVAGLLGAVLILPIRKVR
ncbi:MFS transporter [Amycolatopsis sp. NPDC088138]|uniref:MFS transporter n=1 Tax=Amycolatopsis sp. NPDC088138 TaxID=3363938 RepID=UPI0038029C12